MNDSVTLTVRYSFKGDTHAPRVTVDLDRAMREEGGLPDFLPLLAAANGIDPYSYEYEILPFGEFEFSDATGLAADFAAGENFDRDGFEQAWRERERLAELRGIAQKHLGRSVEADEPLMRALIDAWEAGRRSQR